MDIRAALEASSREELPLGPTTWYWDTLVPKSLRANLVYRKRVLELGYSNREYARQFWQMCSRDLLFYVGTFAWTLSSKDHSKQALRPFIPFPYQERAMVALRDALGEHDVGVLKARDMGGTWQCLYVLEHDWHFHDMRHFLLTSEKEELVDGKGEKPLLRKLDFHLKHLPCWLKPENHVRTKKHLGNPDTHSSIDGEATVEHVGTGDRRTAVMLDETAKMPTADSILTSTVAVTKCRILNSTPVGRFGPGKAFYDFMRNPENVRIFMHWSEHPEKSKGLYKLVDGQKVPLNPATYDWRKDYDFKQLKFVGNKPRSPWYDKECVRFNNDPKKIAQELDLDFHGSSELIVDPETISKVLNDPVNGVREPAAQGRLGIDDETFEATWRGVPGGQFHLWCDLVDGRPPVGEYSAGVDISAGTAGQHSSNSAIVVFNKRTKDQVAEFAINSMKPATFARYCIGVCKWFHDAFLVPEVNGPLGTMYLNELKEDGYWNVYRRDVTEIQHDEKTQKIGYVHKDAGAYILGGLMDAVASGKAKLHSKRIIDELLEYEWQNGRPFHAGTKQNDSESDKGTTHGDVAIAAGCAWLGVKDAPADEVVESTPEEAPRGSIAWLLARRDNESRDREEYARVTDTDW